MIYLVENPYYPTHFCLYNSISNEARCFSCQQQLLQRIANIASGKLDRVSDSYYDITSYTEYLKSIHENKDFSVTTVFSPDTHPELFI